MIRIGCVGFPVARERYFKEFGAVEIFQSFYQPPGEDTVKRWRAQAPKDFQFTLAAWQVITHPGDAATYSKMRRKVDPKDRRHYGHFKDTMQVREAWRETKRLADALDAKVILFATPPSFYPNSTTIRDMRRFFSEIDRGQRLLAWEARGGGWEAGLIGRLCKELKLIHAVNPLVRKPAEGRFAYYRLAGTFKDRRVDRSHKHDPKQFEDLVEGLKGKEALVFFDNASKWSDAKKFRDVVHPEKRMIKAMTERNKWKPPVKKSTGIVSPGERRV